MITFKAKTPNGEIIKSALSPFTFPAGEAHIKREERRDLEPVEIALIQPDSESIHTDLFHLAMWNDYIARQDRENGTETRTVLILPYVPGARADRGNPFGLSVYAEFINLLFVDQIIIFDPHSQVAPELLEGRENLTVVYSDELFSAPHFIKLPDYVGVIAPDKGAVLRAQNVADVLGVPLFKAEKKRDEATGQLSGFTVETLPEEGKLLLVDDICDGGGTFLGLADASGLPKERLDLFVSHGVFSKAACYNLPTAFDTIYTTNSYAPERHLNEVEIEWDTQTDSWITAPNQHYPFKRLDVIRLLLSKVQTESIF